MRTISAVLACVFLAAGVPALSAQTLDELNHPLLPRGGVILAADANTYAVEHDIAVLGWGEAGYFRPQIVLFPQVAIGLAKHLQLSIDLAGQLAVPFRINGFDGMDIRDENPLTVTTARLSYRPTPTVQLAASLVWGDADTRATYARDSATTASYAQTYRTRLLSLAGAWLPGAGIGNRPLRADLDGLRHPLLDARRWRLDGEVQWRRYADAYHETDDRTPDFLDEQIASQDLRLRLGVARGLGRGTQVLADAYWHPSFTMTDDSRSLWSGWGSTAPDTRHSASRYHGVGGILLGAAWRASRAEASIRASWERQGVSTDEGAGSTFDERVSTAAVNASGTWLSRRPRRMLERSGLAGFDHPLVERGQVELEGFLHYAAHREDSATFDTDLWLWRLRATTGLSSTVQVSAYVGTLFSKHFLSGGGFDRSTSSGAEVTLRVSPRAQVYARGGYHPAPGLERYPTFILGAIDPFHYYESFEAEDLAGARNVRVGLKFVW